MMLTRILNLNSFHYELLQCMNIEKNNNNKTEDIKREKKQYYIYKNNKNMLIYSLTQ